ncbi:hypothetical protein DOT_4173 [Desulfosporosinus sp. OT]|nr:hypothetical protein DOT_4173 [Desulfosporosinus sp. OT]
MDKASVNQNDETKKTEEMQPYLSFQRAENGIILIFKHL